MKEFEEYLVLNAYFADPMIKQAGFSPTDIAEGVKSFVSQHIDQNDKMGSLINFLAPAGISMLFSHFKFDKLGLLFGFLASAMHIDLTGMFTSLSSSLKSLVSASGTSTDSIKSAIQIVIDKFMPTPEKTAFDKSLEDEIRIVALAELRKEGIGGSLFTPGSAISYAVFTAVKSIAAKLFGWVFPLLFSACGFLVAGDAANALIGRPSAFTGTLRPDANKPSGSVSTSPSGSVAPASVPKGNLPNLKPNPSYSPETHSSTWGEHYPVNQGSVENMLLDFADDVYDDLKPFESQIKNSRAFKAVTESILDYNNLNDQVTFIPRGFKSKKQIVDLFLRDLNRYLELNPNLKKASTENRTFLKTNGVA